MSSTIFADEVVAPAPPTITVKTIDETDIDLIVGTRNELGRTFTYADLDKSEYLRTAAVQYLASYTGSFRFLAELKHQKRRPSTAQLAGVLNCMVAEINRVKGGKPTRNSSALDDDDASYEAWIDFQASSVGKGTYTVVLPMVRDRVTVRLGPWRADKYRAGRKMRWISFRQGPLYTLYAKQGEGEGHTVLPKMREQYGLVNSALMALFGDTNVADEARLAYALESGRCSRCDRELTVPASLHRGVGPECLKHIGGAS